MENWGCPAFWMSRTPVLSAFAAGKASALVIDVGGANTSVTAIHDGIIYEGHPTGHHVEDRRTLAEINKELERLNRNKARRKARESQKGIHHPKSGNGGDGGSPEPDKVATGTSRKCNNCGQVGHIKTNKNSFAPLPSFTPHHIVALSTRRTDDMGRRKIEIKAIKDDRNRS
ncbi:hypothetical protein BN1708_016570, partial [Verticillium longisporum]